MVFKRSFVFHACNWGIHSNGTEFTCLIASSPGNYLVYTTDISEGAASTEATNSWLLLAALSMKCGSIMGTECCFLNPIIFQSVKVLIDKGLFWVPP